MLNCDIVAFRQDGSSSKGVARQTVIHKANIHGLCTFPESPLFVTGCGLSDLSATSAHDWTGHVWVNVCFKGQR